VGPWSFVLTADVFCPESDRPLGARRAGGDPNPVPL